MLFIISNNGTKQQHFKMRVVHICSCCTCVYNYSLLYACLPCMLAAQVTRTESYICCNYFFISGNLLFFSCFNFISITQKQKKNKNYLRQKINHNNKLGCMHVLDRQCFSLDNKQQTIIIIIIIKIQTYSKPSRGRLENIPSGSCSILLFCSSLQE